MSLFMDEEIKEVESAFGHNYRDDPERLNVIQCDETKDIVACPGSGKTTCLAAKLYLLAKRLPFNNGSGICVLAHTNNTIGEIKKKLGSKADLYISYPNFLGTIQSFVDRFLAIPANIKYYGKRPEWIDADKHNTIMRNFYYSQLFRPNNIERNNKEYHNYIRNYIYSLNRYRDDWDALSSTEKDKLAAEKTENLRLDFIKKRILRDFDSRDTLLCDSTNPKYRKIWDVYKNKLREGILHYDDAYLLTEKYLDEYSTILKPTFSKRFKYVFIDEMQDTAKYQLEIIEACFGDSVVTQRFGDPNQAIFSHTGSLKADKDWIIRDNDPLPITSSKRFREPIACVVNRLGIEPYENPMCGEGESETEYAPMIISFNADNIDKVIEAFVEIIKEKKLHQIDAEKRKPFKAVGWRGKRRNDDKLTIGCYYEKFIQNITRQKKEFDCLDGYMKACEYIDQYKEGLKPVKDIIFRCLAKALQEDEYKFNGRYLTATKLEEKLHEDHRSSLTQLRKRIIEWCDAFLQKQSIKDELRDYIKGNFSDLFENFDPNHIQKFLTEEYEGGLEYPVSRSYENKVIYDGIEIEISTIHGAKGQTHEATLYLETFYKKNDIEDIIEFLKRQSVPSNDTQKSRLKMAYVGMSRPRSLLCVAASEESITGHLDNLKKAGWEISFVDEILQ